ncbi:MAG: multiprotein bridging factor aMBF1 [Candidatus Bathyarchaeota archaeon]|nr:multiprotein bridging factor aMBF1 [Candidatus Bathyarchaeota archaeon]
MRCEVCGRKIHGSPIRSVIEGAKLTVCIECSKHGKIIYDEATPKQQLARKPLAPIPAKRQTPKATVDTSREIVEGYDAKIRQAREKLGLSHEELGKKINEKASVLRKLETGKMTPNNQLVTKLEHTLKIKLLVPVAEEKTTSQIPKAQNRELTLGDLIELGKKGREEPAERKPS